MLFQYFPQGLWCNKKETQGVLLIEIGANSKRFQTFTEHSKDTVLLFEMPPPPFNVIITVFFITPGLPTGYAPF